MSEKLADKAFYQGDRPVIPDGPAHRLPASGANNGGGPAQILYPNLTAKQVEPTDEPLSLFNSSVEDSHARITALQESAADWLATVVRCGGSSIGSLLNSAPPGLSERMYLGSSVPTEDGTSSASLPALFNSGMASHGLFLTLNTSEWRNEGVACSLSAILEEDPDPKYLLSPKACSGILRRSERRGKKLPPSLQAALERREQQAPEVKPSSASSKRPDGTANE